MRIPSLRAIASAVAGVVLGAAVLAAPALANVKVHVDVSSQTMNVSVNGSYYASWKVSTAGPGYHTPRGNYRPTRLARTYFSKKYDNAPMPFSVFFKGGYAIHGTGAVKRLGRPASHGCIRLAPGNAARLFSLVRQFGSRKTRITITN